MQQWRSAVGVMMTGSVRSCSGRAVAPIRDCVRWHQCQQLWRGLIMRGTLRAEGSPLWRTTTYVHSAALGRRWRRGVARDTPNSLARLFDDSREDCSALLLPRLPASPTKRFTPHQILPKLPTRPQHAKLPARRIAATDRKQNHHQETQPFFSLSPAQNLFPSTRHRLQHSDLTTRAVSHSPPHRSSLPRGFPV